MVINITKTGVLDDYGIRIIENKNLDAWLADTSAAIGSINIKNNNIENIIPARSYSEDFKTTSTDIATVMSDVANWLSTDTGYDSVAQLLANEAPDSVLVETLVNKFDQLNWVDLSS